MINAPQVWLLQLHAYMLGDEINGNHILLPAQNKARCSSPAFAHTPSNHTATAILKVNKKEPIHSATSVMLIIIPSTYTRSSGAHCWVCVGAHRAELEDEARSGTLPKG